MWGPVRVVGIEEEIWRMMSVGEVDMKKRMLLSGTEYSVLKEKMKEHQCEWSKCTCNTAHV
jgi:hypothetical protein